MQLNEKKAILLEKYKENFSDEYLFLIVNTELDEEDRIPQIITGDQAEGRIINGYYSVELIGPNPGCKRLKNEAIRARRLHDAKVAKEAALQAAEELKEKSSAKKGGTK